ncbi:5-hydroxyisourate hydrolase [Psychrosphaera saromensis]|uniref:5-hydroxyisourate hydrolase n=1 Tax=Psychrosphaera saromensis TaxID=716813 RepID=A0A2S7URF9_9GAMM|nr:hydroxyisourate hydrolase [Psychrosphaera saromensis]PQJ52517.1 hydroxyisourate hydrolase [Psychrosphaera saromensis]GHB69128.1 5-hydroxyisourate hydrolase [Psychrosphaera saromensis]GLQ12981.1 5-hydroxyisourate hydrolase [Psychrosphaera saromensis]
MSQITTHILDVTRGLPAKNVPITLFAQKGNDWQEVNGGVTNQDGRLPNLLADGEVLPAGIYRMHFATAVYFNANNEKGFYPYVDIVFEIDAGGSHYHIPLLLTAYGYSTYRGS